MTEQKNDQMSLREAAAFDFEHKLKSQLTGWGKVSVDRKARGVSRKERRKQRKAAENA